jgi:hypothetical protein
MMYLTGAKFSAGCTSGFRMTLTRGVVMPVPVRAALGIRWTHTMALHAA